MISFVESADYVIGEFETLCEYGMIDNLSECQKAAEQLNLSFKSDEEVEDKYAFNGKLFTRQYKHRGSNDILKVGQQYKSKIRETVQEHINRGIRFYIVYEVELEKYGDGEEDDNKTVHLHSANRRILNMYEFDDVYEQAMTKINDQFENFMVEGSGWVMDRINSISLNIARMNY